MIRRPDTGTSPRMKAPASVGVEPNPFVGEGSPAAACSCTDIDRLDRTRE